MTHAEDFSIGAESSHEFSSLAAAQRFILSGNAYFVLRSKRSGKHIQFRVADAKDFKAWIVYHIVGDRKHYLGVLRKRQFQTQPHSYFRSQFHFYPTKAEARDDTAIAAFDWLVRNGLNAEASDASASASASLFSQAQLFHISRCGRCGRTLTDPESIAMGLGPECSGRGSRKHLPRTFGRAFFLEDF